MGSNEPGSEIIFKMEARHLSQVVNQSRETHGTNTETTPPVLTLIKLGVVTPNDPQVSEVRKTCSIIFKFLDDQMTSDLCDGGQHFKIRVAANKEKSICTVHIHM